MADLSMLSKSSQSKARTDSVSQASETSQTAADFIKEQLSLEAEARAALPYQFDTCTRDLGPIRQGLYSCLDCNPPPARQTDRYIPAAVCYACSISCHGDHTLVELFNKRNFVCDCGTTRLPENTPCTLRLNSATGQKGGVTGEEAATSNLYNQNFRNKFCGCGETYNPHEEKGTMFQCLGLGSLHEGGCGEDWWHPECLLGIARADFKESMQKVKSRADHSALSLSIKKEVSFTRHEEDTSEIGVYPQERRPSVTTEIAAGLAHDRDADGNDPTINTSGEDDGEEDNDVPLPSGFPAEDDFEYLLCYKCTTANPWIKPYAGTDGFLEPVYFRPKPGTNQNDGFLLEGEDANSHSKKRKSEEDEKSLAAEPLISSKRQKSEDPTSCLSQSTSHQRCTTIEPGASGMAGNTANETTDCKRLALGAASDNLITAPFSLFMKADFHDRLCHCSTHFPLLKKHPQLLEEEDVYEPPVSDDGDGPEGSVGTGSLLDRGEAAFNNMDRVRAIQGAMAYAHLKEGLKGFLKPYAESGQAVGAEDIKAYFEKLRGDEAGIEEAAGRAKQNEDDDNGEGHGGGARREQSGY